MNINSIYNNVGSVVNINNVNNINITIENKKEDNKKTENKNGFEDNAVIYDKVDREAIISKMKADTEARVNQLKELVRKMMQEQGNTLAKSDDIWKFLANGEYTVTEEVKLKAQEDISEDGYWGVEQTSQRIIDFAKALSGNDLSKSDLLFDAFKKGYEEATKAWGKGLPEISKKTYEAVEAKFKAWKEEGNSSEETN